MHKFTDFNACRRNIGKQLYTVMENVWLLEPRLGVQKYDCKQKQGSQMREYILFAILHMQKYMRTSWLCLKTNSHKYAMESKNIWSELHNALIMLILVSLNLLKNRLQERSNHTGIVEISM